MVFPSVPIYLDHHTWLQQQDGDSIINIPPIAPTVPSIIGIDGRVGTRPSSMLEHGRIPKIPYAETPLKCPRCESTNTKFCYFNNYSLSQPRHFCKTCRRYWTRGGALRDVPVGGGCRRSSSKKSKGNQSKSPITLQSNPTSTTPISPNNLLTNNKFIANSNLPIFSSMPNVCEMPIAGGNNELGFQIGKGSSASAGTLDLSAAFGDHWTSSSSHQLNSNQLSCFSGRFEQPAGAYNFNPLAYCQVGTRSSSSAALEVGFAQLPSSTILKHEENQGSKNFQRFSGNDQYWSTGNTWRDISGSSSSASHFT